MEILLFQNVSNPTLATIVTYLGVIQGIILSIIVWNYPRQHKISNRILSLFLFSLVYLYFGPRILEVIDSPYRRLYYGLRTLAPVLLILYIHSLYKKVILKKYLWYFLIIPLDILAIYVIAQLRVDTTTNIDWRIISHTWFIIIYLFFLPIIYQQYINYKKKVLQNFSSTHKIGLNWVTQLFLGFLIIMTFDFLLSVLAVSFSVINSSYASMISTIAFTVFMYFITIKGKLSSEIYHLRKLDDSPKFETEPQTKNTDKTLEENKEIKILADKIVQIIEEQNLYKEMGLTVNDIAEKIDTPPYLVSQAINVSLEKNFFELINRYRVEEAKRLLLDESWNYLSIVGIGFEAGFNSKTAFNTCFKKYTGMTPSQFKKSEQQ